jgi:hypothetical protein
MRTEIRACTQLGTLYKMPEKGYKKKIKVEKMIDSQRYRG